MQRYIKFLKLSIIYKFEEFCLLEHSVVRSIYFLFLFLYADTPATPNNTNPTPIPTGPPTAAIIAPALVADNAVAAAGIVLAVQPNVLPTTAVPPAIAMFSLSVFE